MKFLRSKIEVIEELKRISERISLDVNSEINSVVQGILADVKVHGDEAVEKYTEKFDGFLPDPMRISENSVWIKGLLA